MSKWIWLPVGAALLYGALCALVFVRQGAMLYLPVPRAAVPVGTVRALHTEAGDVLVTTIERPGAKALIYFGGNAEDVALNAPDFARAFPDRSLHLLHYRGYGGSAGQPGEAALVADALQLIDAVRARASDIWVIGRSLGSGVAVQVASQRPVQRLVLVTPYSSMVDVAGFHYPWLPVRWLLRERYESVRFAPRVSAPTLIVAASDDEVIPAASTARLLSAFQPGVARLITLPGTDHNRIGGHADYLPLLAGRSPGL